MRSRVGNAPWGGLEKTVVGVLIATALATLVGMIVLWPGDSRPEISDQGTSMFGKGVPLVDGTVAKSGVGPCGSPDLGRVFDGTPAAGPAGGEKCPWSVVRIETGDDRGRHTLLETFERPTDAPALEVGQKIRMGKYTDPAGGTRYSFEDYQRGRAVFWWAVAAALVIVVVGAWRGIRSLVGIGLTLAVIIGFMVPTLLTGASPVLTALVAGSAALFLTLFLVHGFTMKTASAMLGTLVSLALAAGLSQLAITTARLTGLANEENRSLQILLGDISISGLLLAGFIIGSLGVLNDVTISQASTAYELAESDDEGGVTGTFLATMRVGQDHIASMVYTLVLAYTGSALPLMLIFGISDRPLAQILTGDVVAVEILRSLVGAIAIAFSVPLTTVIAAFLAHREIDRRATPRRPTPRWASVADTGAADDPDDDAEYAEYADAATASVGIDACPDADAPAPPDAPGTGGTGGTGASGGAGGSIVEPTVRAVPARIEPGARPSSRPSAGGGAEDVDSKGFSVAEILRRLEDEERGQGR